MKIFVIFFAIFALVKSNVLERSKIFQDINCNIQDPDLDKCLLNGVRKSLPRWLKGIPELGVPPLDPLYIPKLTIDQVISDFVNITATYMNLEVMGFRNTVINSLKVDPQNLYGSIKITIPWLHIQTDFSLNGKIGPMSIENRGGHSEGNFTDIFFFMKASVKPYKKDDGLEYFKINKLHQEITISDGQIKVDTKDKQYQPAVEMMTSFFNQNAPSMLETASPIISKTSEKMTKNLLDNILSNIPTSEIM